MNKHTPGSRKGNFWREVSVPLLTLGILTVIELLSKTPFKIPNPPAFLLLSVVFAGFRGGLRAGLISAAVAWVYFAYFFSIPGKPFEYTGENFRRVLVWAVTTPAIALMVGVQRRHIERMSDARYRDLFERVPVGLYRATPSGQILDANLAFTHLLGYPSRTSLLAVNMADICVDSEERSRWLVSMENEGLVRDFEARSRRWDGTIIWARDTARSVRDENGRILYYEGSLEDVTERKQAEEEIRRVNAQLEQRVVERTAELIQAKEEADRANRTKSEFLSRMSHELRTPLNAILGFGQLLEMDSLSPEQRESVGHILKGGRHLLELINEVLDIARVEAGRLAMSPEPVPVRQLVRESLDLIAPLAAGGNVQLIGEAAGSISDWHVLADRQRLKQVLLNLLTNAVKYNRKRRNSSPCLRGTP